MNTSLAGRAATTSLLLKCPLAVDSRMASIAQRCQRAVPAVMSAGTTDALTGDQVRFLRAVGQLRQLHAVIAQIDPDEIRLFFAKSKHTR